MVTEIIIIQKYSQIAILTKSNLNSLHEPLVKHEYSNHNYTRSMKKNKGALSTLPIVKVFLLMFITLDQTLFESFCQAPEVHFL